MRNLVLGLWVFVSVGAFAEPSAFRVTLDRLFDTVLLERSEVGKVPATGALSELRRWERSALTAADQRDWDYAVLALEAEQALETHPKLEIPRDLPTPLWDTVSYELLNAHALTTVADLQAWLDRFSGVAASLEQSVQTLAQQTAQGQGLPRFLLAQIASSIDHYLWTPPANWEAVRFFQNRVESLPGLSPEVRRRFLSSAQGVAERLVGPAYRKAKASLEALSATAPSGYSLCAVRGPEVYQAIVWDTLGDNIPAAKVHQWALDDIARVGAELDQLIPAGSEPTYSRALEFLKTEEHFSEDNRPWALDIQARTVEWLSPLFGQPLPQFELRTGTTDAIPNYFPPVLDPPQPAHLNLPRGNLIQPAEAKALLWHEGLPGHALQVGLHVSQPDLAKVRRLGWPEAAVEGWARYAEGLMLDSPLADKYSLVWEKANQYNLAVAVALDTGLNALDWSYKDAQAFLRKTEKARSQNFDYQINRSLYWPGQSLSYYYGLMQYLSLRDEQKTRLGGQFRLRAFHDALLSDGILPFSLLRAKLGLPTPAP